MGASADPIVISGAALASCLGLDLPSTWRAVREGRCGIGRSTALEQIPVPDRGAGQVPDLPPEWMPDAARPVRYLRYVIDGALQAAGLAAGVLDGPRTGLVLGTTLHGMRAAGQFFRTGDARPLTDFQAASVLAAAGKGLEAAGAAVTTCAACASGLASIALGVTLIESGRLDCVIAGGYDPISEYAYAGFSSLRLIAAGFQRPFARDRTGMKIAEGYGIVIMERQSRAQARGAPSLARLVACGASADAHHLSQPHPRGRGAAAAMNQALHDAGLTPGDIDLIAAHATATPDNDGAEWFALAEVFGERLPQIPVTALKSHLGHALGAAGAMELILTIEALREGIVPPVAHVAQADVEFEGLNLVTGSARRAAMARAMVISLGFGGSNACAVVERIESIAGAGSRLRPVRSNQGAPAVITGLGVVLPGAVGNESFAAMLSDPRRPPIRSDTRAVDEEQLLAHLNARRVRRLSECVKLSLAATSLATRHAGVEPSQLAGRGGAITGTTHGSAGLSSEFYRQVVEQGLDAANPVLFAEGVPNAAAAHLSMVLGLRGPCQTIIGSRTAGLDALALAVGRIETGEWDWAIVNAADEYAPLVNRAYSHCGLYAGDGAGLPFMDDSGFACGSGAVGLVIESEQFAKVRGARVYATVHGAVQTRWTTPPNRSAAESIGRMLAGLGPLGEVVTCANATWLDRLEAMALRLVHGGDGLPPSIYGHIAECFAPMSLAALAGVLLTGQTPHRWGRDGETPDARGYNLTVLCSDYHGLTTGVKVVVPREE